MELLTYALLKPMVPFLTITALAAAGWALSELAARRLSGYGGPRILDTELRAW